jgi:hypothetical protein
MATDAHLPRAFKYSTGITKPREKVGHMLTHALNGIKDRSDKPSLVRCRKGDNQDRAKRTAKAGAKRGRADGHRSRNEESMIDPRFASIPETVIGLVPESVACELCVLPFRVDGTSLWVYCGLDPAVSDEERDRLSFILNREVKYVPVDASLLQEAIKERYLPWHEATITNCQPRFRFQCPKSWSSLEPTADTHVRYCLECQCDVHWCENDTVAQVMGRQGKCVALANREYVESLGIIEFDPEAQQ